jgi:8-amino-7-oxononanoate synthase
MAHDPLDWLDEKLAVLDAACLRRRLLTRQGPQRADRLLLEGRQLVNFGSNDYLGLAAEVLTDGVIGTLRTAGWGSGASPLVTGRGTLHAELEAALARFEETEAALLFPSGFAANVGTITALVGRRDVVFGDAKNHASLIDGCRLSGADFQVYPHRDVDHLADALCRAGGFRRRLLVTDSLFSMDGDFAPLVELADLAERFGAMLMVDEAHATGVFGQFGRGVSEHLGVEGGVHVRVGTLSKALGSIGGFVAGPIRLIDWLTNRARTYVFSTAPPEAVAAVGLQGLKIVQQEPHRRRILLERARWLRDRLGEDGWSTGDSASQIIPVRIGDRQKTMALAVTLRERGFFVPGIRPPSVPQGQSLLRISLSYLHTDEMIRGLADALGTLGPASCDDSPR